MSTTAPRRRPTLFEYLEASGRLVLDHISAPVAAASLRASMDGRMTRQGKRGLKAKYNDGYTFLRAHTNERPADLEADLAAHGVDVVVENAGSDQWRIDPRRTRIAFADVTMTLEETHAQHKTKLRDVRFTGKAALDAARQRSARMAQALGLEDLDHAEVAIKPRPMLVRGGGAGFDALFDILEDLAADARDFMIGDGDRPTRLVVKKASGADCAPSTYVAKGGFAPTGFIDGLRESKGAKAAMHAIAVFDPSESFEMQLEWPGGSATLSASKSAKDGARRKRVAAFLEATQADAELIAAWRGTPPRQDALAA